MLPLKEMLNTYYRIQSEEKIYLGNKEGYRQGNNAYFTISSKNKETILMEQAVISYYLRENATQMLTLPIPNLSGDWFTPYADDTWLVLHASLEEGRDSHMSLGARLAQLHQTGSTFSYEPKEISSYGLWKSLWIEKLTAFENEIERQASESPSDYYRLLMDTLPYLIGISENAIQYLQESEREQRILSTDQGTVTFIRFDMEMEKSFIWADQLMYDHPTRDIAEYIRSALLKDVGMDHINEFLNDYQSLSPLSIFGWRLIYARLLFPIHLFDLIELGFTNPDESQLRKMLQLQTRYEKQLRDFFEKTGVNAEKWGIPVLHWL